MYKNTKSTSRSSITRKQTSNKAYLEKLYEHSRTIFVTRGIVSEKLFGEIPEAAPLALIASNKRYLYKVGYVETQISQMPDWFLFHPKIGILIRCIKETAKTNRKIIPFELELIVSGKPPNNITSGLGQKTTEPLDRKPRSNSEFSKTPIEIAFENAKLRKK